MSAIAAVRTMAELDRWASASDEVALEPALPIIDAHHHLWDNDVSGTYLVREFAADVAGGHEVVASVYVTAQTMYRGYGPPELRPVGEVEFANGMAAMSASGTYGGTRICDVIVGHADLMLGDRVRPVLEALVEAGNGRFRGVRYSMRWGVDASGVVADDRHPALDPSFRAGFAHLSSLGLSFDSWQFFPQLPDVVELLEAFPEASVILGHAGGPLGLPPYDRDRAGAFESWRRNVAKLAPFPNLTVKIGGLGQTYCGWDFHRRDVPPGSEELAAAWRPYVETCIELFGVDRCMMESNFPQDKHSCSYGTLWNAMKRITKECSATEKRALYHDTAARVYRIAAAEGA